MRVRNLTGTFWPSAMQERLLAVALDDPQAAVAGWQRLRPDLCLDTLEPGSFELLPLIYRSLTRGGLDDADLRRLKGVYRRSWVTNNLLLERTKQSSAVLTEAGIPALFVEGVVIASRFYPTPGLRPTSAIDVLVDEGDEMIALEALSEAGWRAHSERARRGSIRFLFDESKKVCVLRTTLAIDVVRATAGLSSHALMWATSEPHVVADVDVRVPCATETLYAVCVMHARKEIAPNVQWVADAKMVLRADIDWERLSMLGQSTGQLPRLRDVLSYLGRLPGPKPPRELGKRLATATVTRRQRLSYRCTAGSMRGANNLAPLVAEHLATSNGSAIGTTVRFPRFLRDRWNLAHTWQVPIAAGRRTVARLVSRLQVI